MYGSQSSRSALSFIQVPDPELYTGMWRSRSATVVVGLRRDAGSLESF